MEGRLKKINKVRKEDILKGIKELNISKSGIIMIHSSLSSIGYVVGGADTIIDTFLNYLFPKGTLVMPALCQKDKEKRFENWDIKRSPSDVGRVTEVFRKRKGVLRSDHPTHSVAAYGPKARELISDHSQAKGRPSPWGEAAFGKGSPWERLYLWDAYYLFLGVTLKVNTMGHFSQSLFIEGILKKVGKIGKRKEMEKEVQRWLKPGIWPSFNFEQMEEVLKSQGLIKYGKIGKATVRLLRARSMVDAILKELYIHPQRWLEVSFLKWWRK